MKRGWVARVGFCDVFLSLCLFLIYDILVLRLAGERILNRKINNECNCFIQQKRDA